MHGVSPLQSLDPEKYDNKIPHTVALKRVTESTRQKDAKKKLTNLGEDIESSPVPRKVLERECSGHRPVHQEFPWWGEGPNSIKNRSQDMTMLGLTVEFDLFSGMQGYCMGPVAMPWWAVWGAWS